MARHRWAMLCGTTTLALTLIGCGQVDPVPPGELVINEVVSANDGAGIDEIGETDDYIELANSGQEPAQLSAFVLRDGSGARAELPSQVIPPGGVVLLWADDSPEQGALHLPFKVSSSGDHLILELRDGSEMDSIEVPELAVNDAYSRAPNATGRFARCRFATPGRVNGERCGPPAPPELDDDFEFADFTWPSSWPVVAGPLVLSELALRPAKAVEVLNTSDESVALADYAVRIGAQSPGDIWPNNMEGVALAWPEEPSTLEPGERIVLEVPVDATQALEDSDTFEGVATIFENERGRVIDRVEFMHWPQDAALTRIPDETGRPRFCNEHSFGEANEQCDELEAREVGDRLRNLYTEGDFDALADGDTSLTTRAVKFVVDLGAGGVVHFLSSKAWALHYTFIREQIEHAPPLDRCDPTQSAAFDAGWRAFSQKEYFKTEGRRFLLGTLEHHPGVDLWTVTYTLADQISAAQMLQGFFAVLAHVREPPRFAIRPSEPRQVELLKTVNGQAPIIGMNAPYRDIQFQALTEGVGFGVLTYVPADDLGATPLGRDVIVVTDDVPNDIPLVGGLVTEALQTPLAHVNILSKNRGTPNMALRDARSDAELEPLFDELVRLEVKSSGFTVRRATSEEAAAFFEARTPTGPRIAPRLDTTVRGVQPLSDKRLTDLPSIGAKAAQLAELAKLPSNECGTAKVPTPRDPFAIPVVHSLEHLESSGARAMLEEAEQSADFRADPAMRAAVLEQVREAILTTPVDEELLAEVTEAVDDRFGEERVRFRSSSNTEDLPAFNGAGLYTSLSAELDDADRSIEDAMRIVWASLFSLRAYDEREAAYIDQSKAAMAILVHPAFLSERANSVAISRDLLDPTRADIHYFNIQRGEASVANPAPGVVTEQLTRRLFPFQGSPEIEYQSTSTFSTGEPIMSDAEIRNASCYLRAIHRHFLPLLNPDGANRWFAMDIELKLLGEQRSLMIKQARPYSFGQADIPQDCRDFGGPIAPPMPADD